IVLKKSDGGSGRRFLRKSPKTASSNINDLAWPPTPKFRSGSSEFAVAGVFQHNRPNPAVELSAHPRRSPSPTQIPIAVVRANQARARGERPLLVVSARTGFGNNMIESRHLQVSEPFGCDTTGE
ncbi:MAG: hypothetical protein LH610_00650, partial [Sphingomonas bacterium]|nr:hypothetical protein [Sphingomonas bacterium]